jgi:hypothetical protein
MSTLNGVGFIKKVSTLPNSKTEVAEITILAGKDNNDKNRYLNGSFIITKKTIGLEDIMKALNSSNDDLTVDVTINDFFGHATKSKTSEKIFINYRGLLSSISIHIKK